MLVRKGQVNDVFTHVFVCRPIVSGSIVISNSQPMLFYDIFWVWCCTLFCALGVPALAVGVEASCKLCAASPLSDAFLPVQSPHRSSSCLLSTMILNAYKPCHFFSSLVDGNNSHIITCISAAVNLFIHPITTCFPHCCPHPLPFSNSIYWVAVSDFCTIPRRFLQTTHICLQFHPSIEHSVSWSLWPGAVELVCSTHRGLQLSFHCQVQSQSSHLFQFLFWLVISLLSPLVSCSLPL